MNYAKNDACMTVQNSAHICSTWRRGGGGLRNTFIFYLPGRLFCLILDSWQGIGKNGGKGGSGRERGNRKDKFPTGNLLSKYLKKFPLGRGKYTHTLPYSILCVCVCEIEYMDVLATFRVHTHTHSFMYKRMPSNIFQLALVYDYPVILLV